MSRRLLDSEWTILKALWGKEPQTLKSIIIRIKKEQPDLEWNYKTYHTYLRIMLEKGLIGSDIKNGKDKLYFPMISQEDALKSESENLLSRISTSSVGRLVMMMAENGQLTDQDQKELMELAQRLERQAQSEDQ
jgi:BlaI family transcriptional regulator, penicillinase repressor